MALPKTAQFGSDLHLLDHLDRQQNSRDRGRDLITRQRLRTGRIDLETIDAIDNIKQALFLRFLTPVGELAILGHPAYGSRLIDLIGELNNERTRNRARMFALQAFMAEPRVQKIVSLNVDPNPTDRSRIDITAELLTINSPTPLNFVFPFFLNGGGQSA